MEWEAVPLEDPSTCEKDNKSQSQDIPEIMEKGEVTYGVFEHNGSKYLVYVIRLPDNTTVEESLVNANLELFE